MVHPRKLWPLDMLQCMITSNLFLHVTVDGSPLCTDGQPWKHIPLQSYTSAFLEQLLLIMSSHYYSVMGIQAES